MDYIPYVYMISWSEHDIHYIGSQYGWKVRTANPQNLMTTYMTSSERVKDFISINGKPDEIVILYANIDISSPSSVRADDILNMERAFILKHDAKNSPKYLNASDTFCFRSNDDHSNRSRSKTQKDKWKDPSYASKVSEGIRLAYERDPSIASRISETRVRNGYSLSTDLAAKKKMSESAKIRANTAEGRKRLSDAAKSLQVSLSNDPERKLEISEKISKGNKGKKRQRFQCPHCDKNVPMNVFVRCHGPKCRHRLP